LIVESLSKEQLSSLLSHAKSARRRDWLMILVAYWHGLRASEVIAITVDDLKDGYLTVQRLKGSNKTVQQLVEHSDPLLNERVGLIDYTRGMLGNQKLFPICRQTFWSIVRRYAKAAEIPAHLAHPHILKHSIAMQSIHSAGIENVRKHLGHKSMSSTGEYLKVSDSDASNAVVGALKD
jgi:integrase/recombinase XerD